MDSVEQRPCSVMCLYAYEATWEVNEYKCMLQILHIILTPSREKYAKKLLAYPDKW